MQVSLTVNGQRRALQVEPRTHLADALREILKLTGTHLGCEQGVCGACTVLLDGVPQRSCITYAVDCEDAVVTTIEGFDGDPTMTALREAFSAHHALQCGFCTPGMLVTARDVVLRLGEIPEARLREELAGNICRCTGYVGIVDAVTAVAAGRQPLAQREVAVTTPRAAAPLVQATPRQAPRATLPAGTAMLEERVALTAAPDAAWGALRDLRHVAACLPGAQLDSIEGEQVSGRVGVALGPIKASFAGVGNVTLDETTRSGRLTGRGRDGASSAEGEVRWQVLPGETGGSILAVQLSWRLTGPLAQFGRAALVRDLVRRLAQQFAANLDAMVAGQAPPLTQRLGLFALLWAALKARLLGR